MADEIITFDEILADPTYKSEFDRRVTKALSTVQAKLDAEVEKNRKFEEKETGETVETLRHQLEELQGKYDKDTEAYRTQLADRDYSDAVARTISDKGIKFSSKAAERAYIADLKAKHLELKDGYLNVSAARTRRRPRQTPPNSRPASPAPRLQSPLVPAALRRARERAQCSQNSSTRSILRRNQRRSEITYVFCD